MPQKAPVLAYDLGGTKVAVGVVTPEGKILAESRVPVVIQQGKSAVIRQLADLGQEFLAQYPRIRAVGVAAAGPLDPKKGVLLDPTNFKSSEGTWGKVPLASLLEKRLRRRVFLENDAAAAMLAEHWKGAARGYDNAMILTLGTGLGGGVICNGELVRSGRSLHPETGHIILNASDSTAICGCGNIGCAEAYLSGRNFERRARLLLADKKITAREIAEMARKGHKKAVSAFTEYSHWLSIAIHNYVVLYSPEIVILTGSFASASDLFLDRARENLERLLVRRRVGIDLLPKLRTSSLNNRAGLLGGAIVALRAKNRGDHT